MASAAITRYTPEQYLAMERKADFKSEYERIHHGDGGCERSSTTRFRSTCPARSVYNLRIVLASLS